MGDFRRFILSVVASLEVFFVISATLLCGFLACIVPLVNANLTGQGGGIAFICFIVGAGVGFCISALIVSISVSLAQIVENTEMTKRLLKEAAGRVTELREAALETESRSPAIGAPKPKSELFVEKVPVAVKESSTPFVDASAELTERTKTILLRAKERGYELNIVQNGRAISIRKDGIGDTHCYSNYDIERFNRFAKVI